MLRKNRAASALVCGRAGAGVPRGRGRGRGRVRCICLHRGDEGGFGALSTAGGSDACESPSHHGPRRLVLRTLPRLLSATPAPCGRRSAVRARRARKLAARRRLRHGGGWRDVAVGTWLVRRGWRAWLIGRGASAIGLVRTKSSGR